MTLPARSPKKNRLQTAWDWLVYLCVRLALSFGARLPPTVTARVARVAGALFYYAARRRRRIALRNLDIAFLDSRTARQKRRIARASFTHLVEVVISLAGRERWFPPTRLNERFTTTPEDDARLRWQPGQPLAVLAGHAGDWEMAQHFLSLRGLPLQVVTRSISNPHLDRALTRLRSQRGCGVIAKSGALRKLRGSLRQGKAIGLLADQNCPTRADFFPFFGVAASTYADYARLLVKSSCKVVFIACVRTQTGHFQILTRELTDDLPQGPELSGPQRTREQAAALVEGYLNAVEEVIRTAPEQYLWLHRRWKSRPDGAPWLYHDLSRPLDLTLLADRDSSRA